MRILIVEDHLDTATVMCRLLEQDGHDCYSVGTGAEALVCSAADDFDLVIMDIGLPDVNGWDLLPCLRERRAIKAVAFSGFAADDDVERSRAAGFDAHLAKPVKLDDLLRTIRELSPVRRLDHADSRAAQIPQSPADSADDMGACVPSPSASPMPS